MGKLPVVSALAIVKVLRKNGFGISRQRGSHIILIKFVDNKKRIVVVPNHRQIDPGTLLSIIAQSGMLKGEFLNFLRR
ncbi:MAG: type II toxin-antitoxin system HicA family toxin [Candidatus Micrarchaeota archaeon]|nr:type II toxin-antitoxin system HicA family toxin [Candidatus Micrarchaeota archaeon]MDE1847518.1 type II toxin-antitoxin system HicA family toxin [Candidatus Micrarchaeota archaeon]MDE1863846.1 type II toxin-antitoxin system HicA family toxin [Candidatus Micrarchaeota archaeon]